MSGYYCSDLEINKIDFVSDSLLVILVNGTEVKVLGTEKFMAGTLLYYTRNKQYHETLKELKTAVQSCKASELEGFAISDLKKKV